LTLVGQSGRAIAAKLMMHRRDFIFGSALLALGGTTPSAGGDERVTLPALEAFVRDKATRDHIPGVAACIVRGGEIIWAHAYGFADLERRIPMSLDSLQNIASISKTVGATAVMQVYEAGLIELDANVNEYLSFPIHNPVYPDVPLTCRQLMTHTSSIRDGSTYPQHYACGDPRMSLATWVREYFTPGGHFYNAEENFHPWAPGERWSYSNLAYGLLGHVLEAVSGIPFHRFCRRNIFAHLGMDKTAWHLADIDQSKHVVPYTWVAGGKARGRDWDGVPMGVIRIAGPTRGASLEDGYQPNCLYNHPNFPDGFLRTSVNQMSRFLRAYLAGGEFEGRRILRRQTVEEMLDVKLTTPRNPPGLPNRQQGLTWNVGYSVDGEPAWGHGGRDPGVNTDLRLLPSRNLGAIAFTNTNDVAPWQFTQRFLEAAVQL
jgi:CubicO group peptidase (beta-lactamase class C family)